MSVNHRSKLAGRSDTVSVVVLAGAVKLKRLVRKGL